MSDLLGLLDGNSKVDSTVDDAALVEAMLDVEAALVRALEREGLSFPGSGEAATAALGQLSVDIPALRDASPESGNPVIPLVQQLLAALPAELRPILHFGATSQDILDTAIMLCAQRARKIVLSHQSRAVTAAMRLSIAHKDTQMLGRTMGQPALPTTFGLKAAQWGAGLAAAKNQLEIAALPAQLGGAVGTLAAYRGRGLSVLSFFARELDLVDPQTPWHTERSLIHALAASLAEVVISAGKVATDVLLMSQAEVGEVAEGTPGGSSAMPHKKNSISSTLLVSSAHRVPGLVSTVLSAGLHEHERATGSWHAEWRPMRQLIRLAGGASARVADLLTDLHVDAPTMRVNLESATPEILSEATANLLMQGFGRLEAQNIARRVVANARQRNISVSRAMAMDPQLSDCIPDGEWRDVDDPGNYLGSAHEIADRLMQRSRTWQSAARPG